MPITTSIPSTFRTPGSTVEFDITSGARGLVALTRRVALIGVRATGVGTATNAVPYQIFVEGDGDARFGKGSELALMCRAALRAARKANKSPEIWAISIAEPAGVKSAKTFTVTGPATAAGDVIIRIAGRWISAPVANADTANTVAASIKTAIDKIAATGDLPGVASVATNVVTFTLTQQGVNGEDLKVSVESAPTGIAVAAASSATGTGAAVIQPALDALNDKQYNGVVTANHTTTDITSLKAYALARGAAGVKQWSFWFMAANGTLTASTTLATTADTEYGVEITCEDCPNLPGEIATHVAVTRFGVEDPSLRVSGTKLDLYAPPGPSVFTPGVGGEVESALAAGATPLSANANGEVYIVRLVTTKTTHNSAPYDLMRDFGVPYTLTWMGEQADATVRVFMSDVRNAKMTVATQQRLRSVLLDLLRQAEALRYIQNVEQHKGELQVGPDAVVNTRVNYDLPISVVPGMEQAAGVLRLFVEAAAA
jgi:phage tail sheath gpL-like